MTGCGTGQVESADGTTVGYRRLGRQVAVAERGFPPLAVAVLDVTGEPIALKRADTGMPMTSRSVRSGG